jgi:hypothetical protein
LREGWEGGEEVKEKGKLQKMAVFYGPEGGVRMALGNWIDMSIYDLIPI